MICNYSSLQAQTQNLQELDRLIFEVFDISITIYFFTLGLAVVMNETYFIRICFRDSIKALTNLGLLQVTR